MSWKGFTKAVARLPQRISAKTGYAEETVDSEFVDLYESYKGLESCVRKLHDDSKKFKDALTDMLSHQKKFAETLQEMFQPISSNKSGTPKASLSDLTKEQAFSREIETAGQLGISMDRVREDIIPHLQDIERLVIVPALEYLSLFDQVKKYLTKREHKLVDYDRFREAVKKLKDKKDRSSSEEKKLGQLEFQFDAATREYNNYVCLFTLYNRIISLKLKCRYFWSFVSNS
jgi:amphiphysin